MIKHYLTYWFYANVHTSPPDTYLTHARTHTRHKIVVETIPPHVAQRWSTAFADSQGVFSTNL